MKNQNRICSRLTTPGLGSISWHNEKSCEHKAQFIYKKMKSTLSTSYELQLKHLAPTTFNLTEKIVLKCMGTTQIICCRDHMNIAYSSAGNAFWAYIDWDFVPP
jgi:hypothetical protein